MHVSGWMNGMDALGINESIRPPEKLLEAAIDDTPAWSFALGDGKSGLLPLDPSLPMQYTIMGKIGAWVPPDAVGPNEILDASIRRRDELEQTIATLHHEFYNNGDLISARVSYAPVRLMGWWCKCLSDEIDWLKRFSPSSDSPCRKQSVTTPNPHEDSIPPRYSPEELTPAGAMSICMDACAMQGRRFSEAPVMVERILSSIPYSPGTDQYTDALSRAYDSVLLERPIVDDVIGIDLETTGLKSTRAWVIDAGWLWTDLSETDDVWLGETSHRYGVSETRMMLGNPTESISGISTDELKGLIPLEKDAVAQGTLLSALTSAPFVAHSAGFEDSFFEQNIEGYAEAKRDKLVRIIDTRSISRRLDVYPGKQGNHLEQYAHRWGALEPDEKERHLGLQDSEIMLAALRRHMHSLESCRLRLGDSADAEQVISLCGTFDADRFWTA